MADNQVTIELLTEIKDSLKNLKKFEDGAKQTTRKVQKETSSLTSAFSGVGKAAVIAGGAIATFFAGRALINGIKDVVSAASEEQKVITDLNAALKASGQFTQETSDQLVGLASALEKTTVFNADDIVSSQALIQNLGQLSGEALKDATKSTLDLAAALQIDLTTASQLVGRAAAGDVGTFTRYGLSIEKGATASETFANALEKINKQFGGAAAAQVNTFSGAITQLGIAFGDIGKLFGVLIINNPQVIEAVKSLTSVFRAVTGGIEGSGFTKIFSDLISNAVILAFDAIPAVIKVIGFLGKTFIRVRTTVALVIQAVASLVSAFYDIEIVQVLVNALAGAMQDLGLLVLATAQSILDLASYIPGIGDTAKEASKGVQFLGEKLAGLNPDNYAQTYQRGVNAVGEFAASVVDSNDSAIASFDETIDKAANFATEIANNVRNASKAVAKEAPINVDVNANVKTGDQNKGQDLGSQFDQFLAFANQVSAIFDIVDKTLNDIVSGKFIEKISSFADNLRALPAALIDNVVKIGDAIAGIFEDLPEIVGKLLSAEFIKGIIGSIDKIVTALAENLDDLIIAIIEALPAVAEALIFATITLIPRVTLALIDSLITQGGIFRIIRELIVGIPELVVALLKGLVQGIGAVGSGLAKAFGEALNPAKLFGELAKLFDEPPFLKKLKDIFDNFNPGKLFDGGGGGGIGGAIGKATKALGFAEGGIVPAGFSNDSFPANLSSGELVIPQDEVSRLSSFLDAAQSGGLGGGKATIVLQIGEKELASVLVNLNQQGFRTA